MLMGDIITNPIFGMLRTKHQIGYVVLVHGLQRRRGRSSRLGVGLPEDPDAVEGLIDSCVSKISSVLLASAPAEFVERENSITVALKR